MCIGFYQLMITNNCNLRCKYCFNDWEASKNEAKFTNISVSLDDIVDFINKTRCTHITVEFAGAEPTLNFDFIQEFISKKIPNVAYNIVTNGTMLNSEKIDFLLKHFNQISFSIDGNKRCNSYRIYPDGSNSWEQAISNLIEMISKSKYYNTFVGAMMAVHAGNLNIIDECYKFLSIDLGIQTEMFFDYKSLQKSVHQILRDKLYQMFIIQKMPLPSLFVDKVLSKKHHKSRFFCRDINRSITINMDGSLSFCHLLAPNINDKNIGKERVIGDIWHGINKESGFYKYLLKRQNLKFMREQEPCKSCPAFEWCKGGCLATHIILGKYIYLNQCEINKIIHEIGQKIMEEK